MTDADFSNKNLGSAGATIISAWISNEDNGALTRLDISKNRLFHDDGTAAGKILSDMLAVNSTIQELDVSGNAQFSDSRGGPSFAQALSVGISDNGAMTSLTFGDKQVVTMTAEMIEANLGGKLEYYEAQIIAAFLPKCT
jgi:hypothetical protein